jgi:hypothetical protein
MRLPPRDHRSAADPNSALSSEGPIQGRASNKASFERTQMYSLVLTGSMERAGAAPRVYFVAEQTAFHKLIADAIHPLYRRNGSGERDRDYPTPDGQPRRTLGCALRGVLGPSATLTVKDRDHHHFRRVLGPLWSDLDDAARILSRLRPSAPRCGALRSAPNRGGSSASGEQERATLNAQIRR